MTESH